MPVWRSLFKSRTQMIRSQCKDGEYGERTRLQDLELSNQVDVGGESEGPPVSGWAGWAEEHRHHSPEVGVGLCGNVTVSREAHSGVT